MEFTMPFKKIERTEPAINGSSLADIAFLLLIFFLVTTTMDKDTAYLRKIPKKVEKKTETIVEKKNVYKIVINSNQLIQARDSTIGADNIESLNGRIKHFYLVNRGKKSDRALNYPYYSFGTELIYKGNIRDLETRQRNLRRKLKVTENGKKVEKFTKMLDQTTNGIQKWRVKLRMIKLYTKYSGEIELPEIASQAHIRLESFEATDYSAYVAVQSEIQRAVTEMRNEESKKLFDVSYTAMKKYYQQKKLEKDDPKVKLYKKHMDLIKVLFPLTIIEVDPKR
jgi:biopolymer transport protein ExbD